MRDRKESERGNYEMSKKARYAGLFRPFFYFMLTTIILAGCTKEENETISDPELMSVAGIAQVIPLNLTDSIAVDPIVSVTFNPGTDPSTVSASASTLTLKKGNTPVPGTTSVSGTTAIFTAVTDLSENTVYTATITAIKKTGSESPEIHEYTWKFKTGKHHLKNPLSIVSVAPLYNATDVALNALPSITFNQELTSSLTTSISIILKKGATVVQGTLSFAGKDAIFKPSLSLAPNTVYSGLAKYKADGSEEGDADNNNTDKSFTWSFTTGGNTGPDVTAPVILSVLPVSNATSVAVTTLPTVTFSEALNAATVTSATFTLKKGTTAVAGAVTYSGTTAKFTPSAALSGNTVYSATITTGVKDVAGNALAASYTWNFTTVQGAVTDVTPPTVISVLPVSNATSVAISSIPTVTFSEALNASTVTSATFTLKQGTTAVAGAVTFSGTTAKFTPSAALAGNTVYTATITTGVKDAAGNALGANYTWSFTTVAAAATVSFASDVMPVLNKCNTCHTHKWTTSTVASTYYTNLVNSGYINTAAPTTGKLYPKLNSNHTGSVLTAAELTKVLNWINEGSKNN